MRLNWVVMGLWVFLSCELWARPLNFEYDHVPDQMIVKFNKKFHGSRLLFFGLQGLKPLRTFANGAVLLKTKGDGTLATLVNRAEELDRLPFVDYVEANTILYVLENKGPSQLFPNDPEFGKLYGLHNEGGTGGRIDSDIDAPEAWAISTGSRKVVVGIIDTGVDFSHPDLVDNMWTNPGETGIDDEGRDRRSNGVDDDQNGYVDDWRGWDFVNQDNDPTDDHDHGTHCAGTIGATGNNKKGVVGVNWNVSMVGLKFLSAQGSGTLANAVSAIEYASKIKVNLTSNSWGGGGFSQTLKNAIEEANEQGILFVAAAGNRSANNDTDPHYPSSYEVDNVIAVAATDHKDELASFSCFGAESVDLTAPGSKIYSTTVGNTYKTFSGTSMATPHVAGVIALAWSSFPKLTAAEMKARILKSTDALVTLNGVVKSAGRVSAYNALERDELPPAEVSGIKQIGESGIRHVNLFWQPSGDDGYRGKVARYLVRASERPIKDETAWEQAMPLTVSSGGETNVYRIGGIPLNFGGFVSVRALDNVGNQSPLSALAPIAVKKVSTLAWNKCDSLKGVEAEHPWGVQKEGKKSYFDDSPAGPYGKNADVSLVLAPYQFPVSDLLLSFEAKYDLEQRYDFVHVEISTDGKKTWRNVMDLNGESNEWRHFVLDLSSLVSPNQPFSLRFRLDSDYSVQKDGISIDNVRILGPRSKLASHNLGDKSRI